ncbi:uncharacterized protein LOC124262533 [Haliotis rubra]|uniref:uncharacterized protein LOC124262533 n=1 Tax=Haliotis rubra TaxID=36100 RepID=UPI001EE56BBC|nr:uncharacterized protein LOC124262533 [Haliotis rubra]
MREPLEVGLKLTTTLRFLATGKSCASLQYSFRVEATTIGKFLPEVCKAILEVYKDEVLRCSKTEEEWKEVAEGFSFRWNYHNCLGAVDGKHATMKKLPKAESFYYNYIKGFRSIVLMAHVDAGCMKFLYVDVGAEGGASDGGTWKNCTLHKAVEDNRAGLPVSAPLPNNDKSVPYHFVAYDAFALRTWLMKPFSHRSQMHRNISYSYRLSRARRVVENAFGILSQMSVSVSCPVSSSSLLSTAGPALPLVVFFFLAGILLTVRCRVKERGDWRWAHFYERGRR